MYLIFFVVSDLNGCSRKDFIGKEEVAKIIDDTYRSDTHLFIILIFFYYFHFISCIGFSKDGVINNPLHEISLNLDAFFFSLFSRQMQVPKATDSASKSHSCLANNVKSKKEIADFAQIDIKVRCPCGSSSTTENMIKVPMLIVLYSF